MITQERLKALFVYCPCTGWFINRFSRGRAKMGERAGSDSGHIQGYRRLTVDYERIYEHQAAWLYVFGELLEELDHEDNDGSNNSLWNLRPCTRTQNLCNIPRPSSGESGLRGAYLDRSGTRWYSKIQFGGQQMYLGTFDTALEAHAAFEAAAEQLHGEFYSPFRNPSEGTP